MKSSCDLHEQHRSWLKCKLQLYSSQTYKGQKRMSQETVGTVNNPEDMDIILIIFPCQYEVKAPVPSACFRNICKQMAKMHEAIFDLLPEEQTQVSSNS